MKTPPQHAHSRFGWGDGLAAIGCLGVVGFALAALATLMLTSSAISGLWSGISPANAEARIIVEQPSPSNFTSRVLIGDWPLVIWGLCWGCAAMFALRQAYRERQPPAQWLKGVAVGVVGFIIFTLVFDSFLACSFGRWNVLLDRTPAQTQTTWVKAKTVRQTKFATHYFFTVAGWGDFAGKNVSVYVGSDTFGHDLQNRVRIGEPVNLLIHKGALGVPWVESVIPREKAHQALGQQNGRGFGVRLYGCVFVMGGRCRSKVRVGHGWRQATGSRALEPSAERPRRRARLSLHRTWLRWHRPT